jgi:hypothetical protein
VLEQKLDLGPNDIAEWTTEGATASAQRLRELIAYVDKYR